MYKGYFVVYAFTERGDGAYKKHIDIDHEDGDCYVLKDGGKRHKAYVYNDTEEMPIEGYLFCNRGYVSDPKYGHKNDSFNFEIGGVIGKYKDLIHMVK